MNLIFGYTCGPVHRHLASRATLTLAVILAGWPVIRWYVARLQDGADEPMGLLALVAALAFAPRRGWGEPVTDFRLRALACVLFGYAFGFHFLPPLGRSLLWVAALGWVAAPRRFAWAWSALLVLSLPIVASLQFYLGYPLRCLTTQVAAWVLGCGGIAARPEATVLHWAGERVLIDAPCSGIQMLWTLLLAAAVLANLRRWNGHATFRIFRFASLAVFLANSLRAVVLFCIELRLWPSPPFAHETVGLAMFALAGGALLWRAERIEDETRCYVKRGSGWRFGRPKIVLVLVIILVLSVRKFPNEKTRTSNTVCTSNRRFGEWFEGGPTRPCDGCVARARQGRLAPPQTCSAPPFC